MAETRRIEWPPRSGVAADYTAADEALVRDLIASCEAGAIDEEQLRREVGILHDLKVELDAHVVSAPAEALEEGVEIAPDSWFAAHAPTRVADLLAAHEPQLRIDS